MREVGYPRRCFGPRNVGAFCAGIAAAAATRPPADAPRPPDADAATNYVLARLCDVLGPGNVRDFVARYLGVGRFEDV